MTRKANFFLIGAPKAGTTSIDRVLRQHPSVFLSPIKEPNHFCRDVNAQVRKDAGRQATIQLDAYLASRHRDIVHQHIVDRREDYDRLFEAAAHDAKVIGECSTSYMASTVAAELISDYNPEANFVAVIREPVSRITSHYAMDRRTGIERRPLVQCVEEEIALGTSASLASCRAYLMFSRYDSQIARFEAVFGRDRVLVLVFEEMVGNPAAILARLYEFLGLASQETPQALPRENEGRAAQPRFPALERLAYRLGLWSVVKRAAQRHVPNSLRGALHSVRFHRVETIPGTEDKSWEALPEIQELSRIYRRLVRENGALGNGLGIK